MLKHRGLLMFGAAVLALLWLANSIREQVTQNVPINTENVIFYQTYTLDNALTNDLAAVAQTITLSEQSQVTGGAALVGGNVTVAGDITGNLTAMGETITLGPESQIEGDAAIMGKTVIIDGRINGNLTLSGTGTAIISPNARITGQVINCDGSLDDQRVDARDAVACSNKTTVFDTLQMLRNSELGRSILHPETASFNGAAAFMLASSLISSLGLCGLAVLTVTLFPRQVGYIEEALRIRPRRVLVSGFLTACTVVGVSALMLVLLAMLPVVGLILLPFYLFGALVTFGLGVAGWVTLTLMVGEWLLIRFSRRIQHPPLVVAAVGSVVVAVLLHVVLLLPFGVLIRLILVVGLTALGVGAAAVTRVGTRPVVREYLLIRR